MNKTIKMSYVQLLAFGLLLLVIALLTRASPAAAMSRSANIADDPTIVQPRPSQARLADNWGKMPLYFVANQGQMDERVAFYVQGSDKTLYFTPDGVTFALTSPPIPPDAKRSVAESKEEEEHSRWVAKLDFVNANPVRPIGLALTDVIISYFSGSPDEWHTGLPTYTKIVYPNLWQGVDLVYSGTVNRLKYEFIVQPGADPARIRLAYRGANVRVNQDGQLDVSTPAGGFQDDTPMAYQEVSGQRVPVAVAYALEDANAYGFSLVAYDPSLPLVIDPAVLVYCGYIGGSGDDKATGIAVDAVGNAYVTGWTRSTEATFPVTVGPDLLYNGGQYDAFVAKVKADGTGLVYAGYIGGSGDDDATGIAVDAAGNVFVVGKTNSTQATFPVTIGPDLTYNGGQFDAFVVKVLADGTGLTYCGYIGGNNEDWGAGIAIDTAGNAYVTGKTNSTTATFPVTVGPDLTHNGGRDAFVAKVKADGTGLMYAGYIGGSGPESGYAIAVDLSGNAYVTGWVESTQATFPVIVGPDLTFNGYGDAFVAKVNADGTGLVYAGYIGGDDYDDGMAIAIDSAGNAYVTGWVASTQATFPVTGGPDLTFDGGFDGYVAKVRADGTGLVYCSYIGGNGWDWGNGIAVDATGNAYVTGFTDSTEATFPVIVGPDLSFNGSSDAFVAKVKADGTGLVYAGYIGGSGEDQGAAITVDSTGNTYIAGYTASTEATFPKITGPDLTYNGGDHDAFVAKVSYTSPVSRFEIYLPLIWK